MKKSPDRAFYHNPLFWLVLLTLVGGVFRFYNLNWDRGRFFHPDEPNLLGATAASGLEAQSGWRVGFFAYGQILIYLYRATGELVSTPAFLLGLLPAHEAFAEKLYWVFLILATGLLFRFFPKERFREPAFIFSSSAFALVLLIKFVPVFTVWFASWSPSAWVKVPAALVLAALTAAAAIGWARASRWGRLALALLVVWTVLASLGHAGRAYTGQEELKVIGRWWSALFSTLTIPAVYLFAVRAYKNAALGLIAAAGTAFAVLGVNHAHYCIPESFITLMMVVIALLSFELLQKGDWKSFVSTGAALGLALAAKMSCLYYLAMPLAAWLLRLKAPRESMPRWVKPTAGAGAALLVFFLFSPWSLLDFEGFRKSMAYEWDVVSRAEAFYTVQFKDTPRYWYQMKNLVEFGLGWPWGVTVVLGSLWVAGGFLRRLLRPVKKGWLVPIPFARGRGWAFDAADLLLLCWFLPYFLFVGAWNTKFIRYMVPLIPVFCLFGAKFLTDLFQWMRREKMPGARVFQAALLAGLLGWSFLYCAAYLHVYRYPHPWVEASRWIYRNIPEGSILYNETWDDKLPVAFDGESEPGLDKPKNPEIYRRESVSAYNLYLQPTDDNVYKKNYLADLLVKGDTLCIASKRIWYTAVDCTGEFRPHGYNIYPVASRYYRLLWSGLLGYRMVAEFHNFPSLFGLEFPDDGAEESFSVYDHPRVYIFRKAEEVSKEEIVRRLGSDEYVKGIDRDLMRTVTPANWEAFDATRRQMPNHE